MSGARPRWRLALFALLCLVQLAVPAWWIAGSEGLLARGELFRFRAAPVDPYDAFRGRYVQLALEAATVPRPAGLELAAGERVFATIEVGADGFARFARLLPRVPDDGPYLALRVRRVSRDEVGLDLPFDRYFLEESVAARAEQAYRDATRRGSGSQAWVAVRVEDGRATLEELYLDGRPLSELLAGEP